MKAVFGVALLLVGFTLGYLVLAGKVPAPAPASTSGTSSGGGSGGGGGTTSTTTPSGVSTGATPMGLPTMQHLHDMNASSGGMA
jgi:hypothetical protein